MSDDRVKFSTKRYHRKRKGFCGNKQKETKEKVHDSSCDEHRDEEAHVSPDEEVHVSPDVSIGIDDTTAQTGAGYPEDGDEELVSPNNVSISSKKVKPIEIDIDDTNEKPVTGYRLIDLEILSTVISLLSCPECAVKSELQLGEDESSKRGLACYLQVKCKSCGYKYKFCTSSCSKYTSFDVNKRIVYTMRALGQGYSGIQKFTSLMNMPEPMTQNNYDYIVEKVTETIEEVAVDVMSDAAKEIREKQTLIDTEVVDTAVSCDGSWQKRGYSSLNGVVTAISMDTGKIIDCEAMSRYCKGCQLHAKEIKTDPEKYAKWRESHSCNKNHTGSAGSMEVAGVKRIFERSISKYNLRYVDFYGDGDSKSYTTVKNTYKGLEVKKLECVGHVQKRVGSRLRTLKKQKSAIKKKANDNDKGKRKDKSQEFILTNNIINRLQNYYGIAIRANSNDLPGMKKAVYAVLFHVASSKSKNYHVHCPTGELSWCRHNSDIATGKTTYKPGPGLSLNVISELKPIFENLGSDELLQKCLHGKTQNQNESFNKTIWERLPKTTYCTLTQLKFGVYDAIVNFNIGRKATILIFEKLEMIPGKYTVKGCVSLNKRRLLHAEYKSKAVVRKRRKVIRGKKKAGEDVDFDTEGTVYGAGEFVMDPETVKSLV